MKSPEAGLLMRCVKGKKGVYRMVFNTGVALLDAIVLAVVSSETEGTWIKITQEVRQVIELSESTLYPSFADYKRMNVWKFTTWNVPDVTGGITK